MSERPAQPPHAVLVDAAADLPPDHSLVGLLALGAFQTRQLVLFDDQGRRAWDGYYFAELEDPWADRLGWWDEDPDRFGEGA